MYFFCYSAVYLHQKERKSVWGDMERSSEHINFNTIACSVDIGTDLECAFNFLCIIVKPVICDVNGK